MNPDPARAGKRTAAALSLAGLVAALAAGCAVNPATGRKQAMLISEETEFRIGRQADAEVRKQYGVYLEKPELRAYVSSVGEQLAAKSARPAIEYHFELLDTPIVNAFALPGGFVYITRGILAQMNSEDELAAVLGHEIGHVAARHGASQISKAYVAQTGLIALSVLGGPGSSTAIGDLANLAVSLALQGYSREHERQADEMGVRYETAAGFNPTGAVRLLRMLARLEKKEPSAVESFFQSHPCTSERINNAQQEVTELQQKEPEAVRRPLRRDGYLSQLDGMAVGVWNGRALVLGNKLYDKEHGLVVEIPGGFTGRLEAPPLVALLEREKEKIQAGLSVEPLPRKMQPRELFGQNRDKNRGLKLLAEGEAVGTRLPVYEARFSGRDARGDPAEIRKAFAVSAGFGVTVTLIAPPDKSDTALEAFDRMVGSLSPISPAEAAALEPPRLKIHQVEPGESWVSLAPGEAEKADRLAAFNGFDAGDPPPIGKRIKIPPSLSLD